MINYTYWMYNCLKIFAEMIRAAGLVLRKALQFSADGICFDILFVSFDCSWGHCIYLPFLLVLITFKIITHI